MTDPWNLFTSADPTAAAAVPWSTPSAVVTDLIDGVRSATQVVVLSVAVATGLTSAAVPTFYGDIDPVVELDDDPVMESIWTLAAEREAISEGARFGATDLLFSARGAGLPADRALADPEGGVALYFFGARTLQGGAHARYARLGVANDGEILGLLADRETNERVVWDATTDIPGALERVRGFLS